MRFAAILLFLTLISGFLPGCFKGGCDECQAAIDHMHEKIQQLNCNPAYMQNAVESINEKCGPVHSDALIGLMAETCYLGRLVKASCRDRGKTGYEGVNINFQKNTTSINNIEVLIYRNSEATTLAEVIITTNGVYPVVINEKLIEDDMIQIEVFYNNLSAIKENKFTYDRVNAYHLIRGVRLVQDGAAIRIEFENW